MDIKEKERQMPLLETTYRISIPGKTSPIKTLTDSLLQSLQAYLSVNHLSKPRTRNSIQNFKTRPRPPTRTSVACFPTWGGGRGHLHRFKGSQHAKYVHPGSEDPAQRSQPLPPAPPPHSQPHFLGPECTQDTS